MGKRVSVVNRKDTGITALLSLDNRSLAVCRKASANELNIVDKTVGLTFSAVSSSSSLLSRSVKR